MSKSPVTDYYDDVNHQQLYSIEKLYGTPDFVKKADVESKDSIEGLPTTSFADPTRRKFPMHTKSATWLAQAYFSASRPLYNKEEADRIQDRITKTAAFWQISGLCDGFRKTWMKIASTDVPNLADSDYALVTEHEGHKIRRMPMPNALSVKAACDFLYANRMHYPYLWRKQAAINILNKAIEFDEKAAKGIKIAGADLNLCRFDPEKLDYLEKAAGLGMCRPKDAGEKLAQRVYMLGETHDDYREKLAEMAIAVSSMPTLDPNVIEKIAEIVDGIDRDTGLYRHYVNGVDLPEEMFFMVLQKQAEDTVDGYITLTTGNSYPVEILEQLPLAKIAEVLGPEILKEMSNGSVVDPVKFAEIARTLPRPDAQLLEKAIDAAIVKTASKNLPQETYEQDSMESFLSKVGKPVKHQFTTSTQLHHSQRV